MVEFKVISARLAKNSASYSLLSTPTEMGKYGLDHMIWLAK